MKRIRSHVFLPMIMQAAYLKRGTKLMTTAHEEEEQGEFYNYTDLVTINCPLFDHTNEGTTFNSVRLIGGGSTETTGLAKTLSVMPGDTIRAEVYVKYLDPDN